MKGVRKKPSLPFAPSQPTEAEAGRLPHSLVSPVSPPSAPPPVFSTWSLGGKCHYILKPSKWGLVGLFCPVRKSSGHQLPVGVKSLSGSYPHDKSLLCRPCRLPLPRFTWNLQGNYRAPRGISQLRYLMARGIALLLEAWTKGAEWSAMGVEER